MGSSVPAERSRLSGGGMLKSAVHVRVDADDDGGALMLGSIVDVEREP